jgi:vesicle coat complex subunit
VNLANGNPGIVLSTIRIIVKFMDYLTNNDIIRSYCSKVTQTLITLMGNSNHEFKYIVLKNINIIIQKRPLILNREIKIFFCSHNDPHYLKNEKLEILLRLADDETIDPIILELKEYVTEIDIDFVRKCIRTFGRLAIKLESSSDICVQALFDCLKTKVGFVIQETTIVMRDIFRRYPSKYESILVELFKNIANIDEPEAKSAIIWIIGAYIEIIPTANKLMEGYLDGFKEDTTDVQIQIMTSCIKLYVVRPAEGGPLVKKLFQIIETIDNPDIRDRGYFYWRMLNKSAAIASAIVSAHKPPISDMSYNFESSLLEK